MVYAVEMPSCRMIFLPSFTKIGTGVQATLQFCLRNLRGSNTGTAEGRNL
jgi:hypothetical protein